MKKLVLVGTLMLVILMGVICVGCDDEKIKFTIGVENKSGTSSENHSLITIIRSVQELDEICDEVFYAQDLGGIEQFVSYDLKPLVTKYDTNYFETKAIIVYFLTHGSGSTTTTLKSLSKNDDTLTLNVRHNVPSFGTDDMAYWTFVLEVEQKDIENIICVEVNTQN